MTRLQAMYAELVRAAEELATLGHGYRNDRDGIRRSEHLTDAGKAEEVTKRKAKAEAAIAEKTSRVREMRHNLEAEVERVRNGSQPTGNEAVAARIEAAEARQRVRSMLERSSVQDILRRAEANGDRATLEALRAEAAYMNMTPETLGATLARELGHENETFSEDFDPAPLVARIDAALVPFLPRDLAESVTVSQQLAADFAPHQIRADAALAELEVPSLATAVAARLATPQSEPAEAGGEGGDAA